jgi:hypothetical protein
MDAFIRRYGPAHTHAWTVQIAAAGEQVIRRVAVDESHVYVVGDTTSSVFSQTFQGQRDGFVAKYTYSGTLVWGRLFGDVSYDFGRDVAVDGAGSVYVVGHEDLGLYGMQHMLRKYDSAGTLQFAWWPGTNVDDLLMAVDVDATGLYVAGSQGGRAFLGKLYDGYWGFTWEWFHEIGPTGATTRANGLKLDGEGFLYLGGMTNGAVAGGGGHWGGFDGWFARYDTNGTHVFTRQFGTSGDDQVYDVVVGPDLTAHLIGTTNGSLYSPVLGQYDAFVSQWNVWGERVRSTQFGTASNDTGAGLASTQRKQCAVGRTADNAYVRCAHNNLP